MINRFLMASILLLTVGCTEQPVATPAEDCRNLGHVPETQAYERCVREENMRRLLEEQRAREEQQNIRQQQEQTLPRF